MIVVDASALVELLTRSPAAETVEDFLMRNRDGLHAPHLVDVECAHVIRRFVQLGIMQSEHAQISIGSLQNFRLIRHSHVPLLGRVWALRASFTAYDAVYVALAESLQAPLLTRDKRLARAAAAYVQSQAI
ncbi:MAG TPA: type II toxin-antitoxin system VapC family toxin [Micropepsaceae bacterium]|nr:type II toxin-antitoxin system VapC family toxin [Micropepsaceae bacterium]